MALYSSSSAMTTVKHTPTLCSALGRAHTYSASSLIDCGWLRTTSAAGRVSSHRRQTTPFSLRPWV